MSDERMSGTFKPLMPTEPSAEDRFVEAMRGVIGKPPSGGLRIVPIKAVEAAVEAFADAMCLTGSDYATCYLNTIGTEQEHAACRARLLARVMEEADGR